MERLELYKQVEAEDPNFLSDVRQAKTIKKCNGA